MGSFGRVFLCDLHSHERHFPLEQNETKQNGTPNQTPTVRLHARVLFSCRPPTLAADLPVVNYGACQRGASLQLQLAST